MDAELQDLIDRAFADARLLPSTTAHDDRRSSQRRPFRVTQCLAPWNGSDLPSAEQFVKVQCDNVSTGGMGFYWPETPKFQQMIVVLGVPPRVDVLVARVMHSSPDRGPDGECLVGCRFVKRLNNL